MIWIIYALMSALFQSVNTVIGKKELLKEHSTEYLTIYFVSIGILSFVLIPFVNFDISLYTICFILFLSILFIEGGIFGTKALKRMDISVVTPLTNLSPIFLIIIAYLFLGEKLSSIQLFGIIILIFGAYILEVNNDKDIIRPFKKLIKAKHFHYLLLSMFLLSLTAIGEKYLLNKKLVNPISLLFFMGILGLFVIITLQFLFFKNYKGVKKALKVSKLQILLSAIAFLISAGFYYFAVNLVYVSIVVPIKRLSTLISTIFGGGFFHEKNLFQKTIACVVMLIGLYLVVFQMI